MTKAGTLGCHWASAANTALTSMAHTPGPVITTETREVRNTRKAADSVSTRRIHSSVLFSHSSSRVVVALDAADRSKTGWEEEG